jgi:hypothetical protein
MSGGRRTVALLGQAGVAFNLAHRTHASVLVDQPGLGEDREAQVPDQDQPGKGGGQGAPQVVVAGVVHPEALEHGPGAVEDVPRQGDVGHHVDDGHG